MACLRNIYKNSITIFIKHISVKYSETKKKQKKGETELKSPKKRKMCIEVLLPHLISVANF